MFDFLNLKSVDKVLAVCHSDVRFLAEKYPFLNERIVHTSVSLDLEKFPMAKLDKNKICKKYNLPKNKRFLLFVGRLEPQKGIKDLLEIFNKIRKECFDLEMIIVGGGPQQKDVEKSNAIYLGRIPNYQLFELYNIADLFISLAYYETGPVTLLETMSCGCLPLISDVGDARLMLENNRTLLIDPKDYKLTINRIKNVLSMGVEEKSSLQTKHRNIVERKYNCTTHAQQLIELYQNLL